ncbi:alpha-mannosidase [Jeotgalibacillus proteolyticus]|uniref:Alpha-mannosidase n=1 Tax=Jeotgalibacillus proteolyticus TaxID=2082395 RepID=A0A2S5GC03_9BACL|nr:alpha-mannosidase [Jeotgalibacillus proteolyticus]PPA70444.1 alpha-mannosidase [Jeotgalibacillus proteolyticus]
MFYRIEKLEKRINELDRLRYRELEHIDYFKMYHPKNGEENLLPSSYSENKMNVNDTWSGRDKYLWLNSALSIPKEWKGKKVVLFLDLGRTGPGNNSGFESLLYVDQKPFQGVDSNHREVILPQNINGEVDISLQVWSGLEGGGVPAEQFYRLKEAWIAFLDEKADELFFKSKALLDSIKKQDLNDPNQSIVLSSLNRSLDLIDWSSPRSDGFYDSLYSALYNLTSEIEKLPKHADVSVHTIGHSHIDLAWLWRTKHTKEKAKRTFSTVLRLMELYPDYTYLQSQPQLYEWIKEEDPDLFEAIKQKVKDGQWEVEGSMWVEADCNIPSGESFVRQLLYGKQFFEKEFNQKNRTLWLPDVFGYSWSLPQILRKSGISTFMTTKISWNQYNRMPHDTFKWRGIDGSEVLTHFITTPEPGRAEDSWFYTYNGLITAETVKGIWENYRDKELNKDLLLAYGYGDGGGGVNREMIEMKRQLDTIPSMPAVKSTKVKEFFKKLHKNIQDSTEYIHTWDGELYLEYHRGTYTSQAKMKEMNRKLEYAYREAEWLSTWNGALSDWKDYPSDLIKKGWKLVLLNQFHDIIPGSSITEVYVDALEDYQAAASMKDEIVSSQENQLIEVKEASWSYSHPHQYHSPLLLTVPEDKNSKAKGFKLEDKELVSQTLPNGDHLVLIEQAKPFSYQSIVETEDAHQNVKPMSEINLKERTWNTPHYTIEWNENGQLTSIYDKNEQREIIASGKAGNVFKLYEDKPLAHDAWDIDLFYHEKSMSIDSLDECTILENGPIRTTLNFVWRSPQVEINQQIHSYTHSKRIDFNTHVEWTARQKLLKVEFPVDIRTTEAIYDIQFGNVKRPNHWNTSWDQARFESVGHKWAALAEPYYGVSLMNNSKYGYSIKENILALSLLKGPIFPDPLADIGSHEFVYSIYPFTGQTNKQDVEREATYLNSPARVIQGSVKKEYQQSLFSVSSDQVILDTIKKAEEGESVIVRFHEMEGSRITAAVTSALNVKRWREVNLMEEDEKGTEFSEEAISLAFTPYEIKTIQIEIDR